MSERYHTGSYGPSDRYHTSPRIERTVITLSERRALVETEGVTLDGKPAKISGYCNPFATVQEFTTGLHCDFAWPTVARIVANGGAFKS